MHNYNKLSEQHSQKNIFLQHHLIRKLKVTNDMSLIFVQLFQSPALASVFISFSVYQLKECSKENGSNTGPKTNRSLV